MVNETTVDGKQGLSSTTLLEMFKIVWSPEGLNERFVIKTYIITHAGSGRIVGEMNISLENILTFITGADHIPPMGFEGTSEVHFTGSLYEKEMRLPSASTCGPTLYLPLCLSDVDIFTEKMDIAIVGAQSFGIP